MNVLLACLISLSLGLAVQWVVWRVRLPHRQTRAILLIFGALSLLAAVFLQSSVEIAYFTLLQAMLIAGYVITYSAVEVDSPSLVMIEMLADAPSKQLHFDEWAKVLSDDVLVHPRIADLVRDGHVSQSGDLLTLTPKGRSFISIFLKARAILGMPKGG